MKHNLTIGPQRGYPTTKLAPEKSVNKSGKRKQLVERVCRSVTGYNFYQRRIIELTRTGSSQSAKRAARLCKRKLGTNKRAKRMMAKLIQ